MPKETQTHFFIRISKPSTIRQNHLRKVCQDTLLLWLSSRLAIHLSKKRTHKDTIYRVSVSIVVSWQLWSGCILINNHLSYSSFNQARRTSMLSWHRTGFFMSNALTIAFDIIWKSGVFLIILFIRALHIIYHRHYTSQDQRPMWFTQILYICHISNIVR